MACPVSRRLEALTKPALFGVTIPLWFGRRNPTASNRWIRGERAQIRSQAQRVELPSRAFQARLNYDGEAEEVVVEILDPETGDVLQRLPAEKLPDDIRTLISDNGPLVETFA